MIELGWREWAVLPDLGLPRMRAKIDTGARSCALHVDASWRFAEGGAPWIGFRVRCGRKRVRMVEAKKLIEGAQRAVEAGEGRPWTASNVKVGGGDFGTVQIQGREDTLDFIEVLKAADQLVDEAEARTRRAPTPPAGTTPLLSVEIERYLSTFRERRLAKDTVTESRHALRILFGVVGDIRRNSAEIGGRIMDELDRALATAPG